VIVLAAMTYARCMPSVPAINDLLQEADGHPVVGWDFSWLGGRITSHPLPWDYGTMIVERARRSPDLLDLGTGGGEFLAGLAYHPPRTVATEAWPPNVEAAQRRLRPLGIEVVAVKATPDNDEQIDNAPVVRLPFATESFSLIASRHTSYTPSELARILTPGGAFLTQQVGGDYGEFYDALGLPRPPVRRWNRQVATCQLSQAGLEIRASGETSDATTFSDIGAFAWFLTAIPWAVEGFSTRSHRSHLSRLHRRLLADGPITIRQPAFWVEAIKPDAPDA
jgi:SAM-dependent methyltransferase